MTPTTEQAVIMPFGLLLDLWECHRQYNCILKPKTEVFIEDIIPKEV